MGAGIRRCLAGVCSCAAIALWLSAAAGQTFRYEARPRSGEAPLYYSDPAPAPAAPAGLRRGPTFRYEPRPRSGAAPLYYSDPAPAPRLSPPPGRRVAATAPGQSRPLQIARQPRRGLAASERRPASRGRGEVLLTSEGEVIPPGVPVEPFIEDSPPPPPGASYYLEAPPPDDVYDPLLVPHPSDGAFLDERAHGGCGQCKDGCSRCYLARWRHHVGGLAGQGAYTENISLYSGKQGFKGPVDQNVNGDFGFHVGANYGIPLFDSLGVGFQIGANLIISDFEGYSGPLGHRRNQFFATMGAFRRAAADGGFQGGAVVDYLRDDFYIQMDMTQARAELSYLYREHEIGAWGAFTGNTSTHLGTLTPDAAWTSFAFEANNQYNLFYRCNFENGSWCRTWIGMSGFGDGIFGSDATIKVTQTLGLVATYNYLLPRNQHDEPKNQTESWNLMIAMVWYPFYKKHCDAWHNPYRPLFYVADNGWLLQRLAN